MADRYERIRAALEMGPTPGPWFHGAANGAHMYCVYDKRCWTDEDGARHGETPNMVVVVSPDDGKYANAAHIAACDPDTIRALLEERDALAATLAATEAARDGYRDDAHQLHAALVRMVAQYESEFDHEDTYKFRPEWLREALARTNALQEGGEGWEIEPETLDAAIDAAVQRAGEDAARKMFGDDTCAS